MSDPAAKEFLDTAETAQWLGVPEYTVTREAREGRLPGRKVGRGWRFSRTVVLEYFRGALDRGGDQGQGASSRHAGDATASRTTAASQDGPGCG